MMWKIFYGWLFFFLLIGTINAEFPKQDSDIQTITGRIHTYEDYYIFKESGKKEKYYILLESQTIKKSLNNLDLLQNYVIEGYIYSMNNNEYLLPVRIQELKNISKKEHKLSKSKKTKKTKSNKKNTRKKAKTKAKAKRKSSAFSLLFQSKRPRWGRD